MGKDSGGSQTTQSADPWVGVQPYLSDSFSRAKALATANSGVNANQSAGYGMIRNLATQNNPMNTAANNLNTSTLNGDYLSPDSNPYLKQNVNTALDAVQSRVNSQFSGNNYGSSANQELLTRNLGDTAAQMYGQNYTNERNNQQQALGLTPSLNANNFYGANQLLNAGNAQQSAEWLPLQNYSGILGNGNNGGSSTSKTTQSSDPLSTLAGLGLTAFSYFSDERLKTDIKPIGIHPLGVGIYSYKKFGKPEVGVLAQEVEKVMPEAVKEHPSGYKMVDYGLLN